MRTTLIVIRFSSFVVAGTEGDARRLRTGQACWDLHAHVCARLWIIVSIVPIVLIVLARLLSLWTIVLD